MRVGSVALAILGVLPPSAQAERGAIYRTTQPDGTVVFTDRPAPDAERLETRALGTSTGPDGGSADAPGGAGDRAVRESGVVEPGAGIVGEPRPAGTGGATDGTLAPSVAPAPSSPATGEVLAPTLDGEVDRVEIASPPPDATLLDPTGPLLVEIGTAPGSLAASGLVAEALVDGEVVASGESSTLVIPPLERGTHELRIRLVDVVGGVVAESESQPLHVRRTTVASGDDDR